jgi:hypothetical protein
MRYEHYNVAKREKKGRHGERKGARNKTKKRKVRKKGKMKS